MFTPSSPLVGPQNLKMTLAQNNDSHQLVSDSVCHSEKLVGHCKRNLKALAMGLVSE